MRVRTSPRGRVYEVSLPHEEVTQAYLADFDIDGADLKPAHVEWLRENLIRPIQKLLLIRKGVLHGDVPTGIWHIRLIGHASRTGTQRHNLELSRRRSESVRRFLYRELPGGSFEDVRIDLQDGFGEHKAASWGVDDKTEDEFFRSVQIMIQKKPAEREPQLPDPKPPPLPECLSELVLFQIRQVDAIEAGAVVSGSVMWFEILHRRRGRIGLYRYTGFGAGWSLPLGKNAPKILPSVTLRGDWNYFADTDYTKETDFSGEAKFTGASAFCLSWANFVFGGYVTVRFARECLRQELPYPNDDINRATGELRTVWRQGISDFKTGCTVGIPSVSAPFVGGMTVVGNYDYRGD